MSASVQTFPLAVGGAMQTCPEGDLAFKVAGALHPLPFLFRAGETYTFGATLQWYRTLSVRNKTKVKGPPYGLTTEAKCKWAGCFGNLSDLFGAIRGWPGLPH